MKYIALLSLIFIAVVSSSQNISREEYIRKYQLLAIDEMNRSGIPASITMAQGCLESADGNSELAQKSKNHFGIKCKKGWRGPKVYYDDDRKNECFRKYTSVEESFIDHTNFLMENPRYADLFRLDHTDYKGWARGLKRDGYATARDYDKRLIKIIEDYKLHRLDLKMTFNQLPAFEQQAIRNKGISNTLTINAYHSHDVMKINRIKAVAVRQGDTFEMLAQEFGMNDWELYKYNDRQPGYRPVPNEVIYLHPKKNKAPKGQSTHRFQEGESMHFISQRYGVKLKTLYKRNKMKSGQQPKAGKVIYLR